ncbi:MAG: hypothetical protein GEU73_02745 [Chloroflexi bacterium]|nr:hypothetical protein [Chloroflexota bacterium]
MRNAPRAIIALMAVFISIALVACTPAAGLVAERDALQQGAAQQAGRIADLEGRIADADARLTEARDTLTATKSERDDVQALLEETASEHEAFLATEKVLVDGLIAERNTLASKGRELEAKLTERQNAINAVVGERDAARTEREQLKAQVASLNSALASAAATTSSLLARVSSPVRCYYSEISYYGYTSGSVRCY